MPKTLFAFGLNHKTAPVAVREKLHLRDSEIRPLLAIFRRFLSECFILSTCNRTEIYAVSESVDVDVDFFKQLFINFKNAGNVVTNEHFFEYISCLATQQIFNVACSIDSKVIGDSQILSQVRNAYSIALETRSTGKILNQLLQRAFGLGKKVCIETSIRDGAVSVSLAAVKLAVELLGSLEKKTVLVIGAGEMARQTAEALVKRKVGKLVVTNRSRTRANQLISDLRNDFLFNGETADFGHFRDLLPDVDIIISSTGSEEPILYRKDFMGQQKETLVIDIAVPRDADASVSKCENVILRNIDDLNSIVDGTRERRLSDVPKVKKMVTEEMVDFLTWYYMLALMPEYQKTGLKPTKEQTREVLRIKEFLNHNVSEIHSLYSRAHGNFNEDLANHFDLVKSLQLMKERSFAAAVGIS